MRNRGFPYWIDFSLDSVFVFFVRLIPSCGTSECLDSILSDVFCVHLVISLLPVLCHLLFVSFLLCSFSMVPIIFEIPNFGYLFIWFLLFCLYFFCVLVSCRPRNHRYRCRTRFPANLASTMNQMATHPPTRNRPATRNRANKVAKRRQLHKMLATIRKGLYSTFVCSVFTCRETCRDWLCYLLYIALTEAAGSADCSINSHWSQKIKWFCRTIKIQA